MDKPDTLRKPHATLPPGMERRNTPRFGCDRGVQCWKQGNNASFWGAFIDLSMSGCSIHTPTPLAPGSRLRMMFTLFGTSVRVVGDVRTLHGNVMGVAFAQLTEAEQQKLANVLQRLADGRSTGSEVIMNTQAAILRLQRWFKTNDLLTRDLFQRLVDGSFDPALGSNASPRIDKSASGFPMEKAVADLYRR